MLEILNDPEIMPNLDCRDIIVSIGEIAFGKTVRQIKVQVGVSSRSPETARQSHALCEVRARALGRDPPWYHDFTDMLFFRSYAEPVGLALQRKLRLRFVPEVELVSWAELGSRLL